MINDPEVMKILRDGAKGEPVPISSAWKTRLLTRPKGGIVADVANAIIALRYAPEWHGVLGWNEMSLTAVARALPPFGMDLPVPFSWSDYHDILAAAWFQQAGIEVAVHTAAHAVHAVAKEFAFHPVRDYLDSLTWDKIDRINDWLTLYLGADPSD